MVFIIHHFLKNKKDMKNHQAYENKRIKIEMSM